MDRTSRQSKNYNIGVVLVENLWGDTQRGKQLYHIYMHNRRRSDLEGPRQGTFKRLIL